MGRNKIKRSYTFKPKYKKFALIDGVKNGEVSLLHEEIEALFLLDHQNLYQEDAAKMMQVSRPTLSRIIKNARNKIASALVCGYDISLQDEKENYKIALATNGDSYESIAVHEAYIDIFEINEGKIVHFQRFDNPGHPRDIKIAQVLPRFLSDHHVTYLISSTIGEGLKSALLLQGIYSKQLESFYPSESAFCSFL